MTNRIDKTTDIAAPIERVWQALTDHEAFGTWFRVKLDQPFVADELHVALDEERQLDPCLDHRLQERPRLGIFVEVVRREHDQPHPRLRPQRLRRGLRPERQRA